MEKSNILASKVLAEFVFLPNIEIITPKYITREDKIISTGVITHNNQYFYRDFINSTVAPGYLNSAVTLNNIDNFLPHAWAIEPTKLGKILETIPFSKFVSNPAQYINSKNYSVFAPVEIYIDKQDAKYYTQVHKANILWNPNIEDLLR